MCIASSPLHQIRNTRHIKPILVLINQCYHNLQYVHRYVCRMRLYCAHCDVSALLLFLNSNTVSNVSTLSQCTIYSQLMLTLNPQPISNPTLLLVANIFLPRIHSHLTINYGVHSDSCDRQLLPDPVLFLYLITRLLVIPGSIHEQLLPFVLKNNAMAFFLQ